MGAELHAGGGGINPKVSNLLGIAQQYGTNKIIGAPVVKQVRPPAERRLKQAGSGRTEGANQ